MNIPNGIFLCVPGQNHAVAIAVSESGQSIRDFVKKELEPTVDDKSAPLEELLDNSGVLIEKNGVVTLISHLVTTAGGTYYLRLDRDRECYLLPDGAKYSGQLRYDKVYKVELGAKKIGELAKVLDNEGMNTIRIPPGLPAQFLPRIRQAKEYLTQFVSQHSS